MARKKIRSASTFSLSFLDIMSCGLGAAVLIFLLLKHAVDSPNTNIDPQTLSEINLLEEEILIGEKNLARIRNTISTVSDEAVKAQGLARQISDEVNELKSLLEPLVPDSSSDIAGLKRKIARLEKQKKTLEITVPRGTKAYEFTGDGERQYLTGVKLGGENILLLIDSSASMLDETIINILRRRNMSDAIKSQAPKWQRTLAIAQWLIANLPLSSDFQVLSFNNKVQHVFGDEINRWYEVGDRVALASAVQGIKQLVPENGTDLRTVLETAMTMVPKPDNIYIITDGLPTLDGESSKAGSVSGRERLRIFKKAIRVLDSGISVNTFLLPLEGDPYAAASFWRLAIATRGAYLTPARGWP